MNYINLVKINVGSSSVNDVKEWQTTNKHKWPDGLPRHITRTSSGILKYSMVLAKAKELGGIIHSLPTLVTKLSFLKSCLLYTSDDADE